MIRDRILAIAQAGDLRGAQIAAECGTTRMYVYRVCRLAGVPLRRGRPPTRPPGPTPLQLERAARVAQFLRATPPRKGPQPRKWRCDCLTVAVGTTCPSCGQRAAWAA